MKPSKVLSILGGCLIGICGYVWCRASAETAYNEGQQDLCKVIVKAVKDYDSSTEKVETSNEVEG